MGQFSGSGHAQRVEGCPTDGDCAGGLRSIKLQDLGDPCGHPVSALDGVVESSRPDGSNIGQPALDLIGDRQSGHQVPARGPDVFTCSQDRSKIVTGVTSFPFGQVTVIEIEVTYQCTVVKRGAVDVCAPAPNQGTVAAAGPFFDGTTVTATQFGDVATYHAYGFSMQRTQTAAQRV